MHTIKISACVTIKKQVGGGLATTGLSSKPDIDFKRKTRQPACFWKMKNGEKIAEVNYLVITKYSCHKLCVLLTSEKQKQQTYSPDLLPTHITFRW